MIVSVMNAEFDVRFSMRDRTILEHEGDCICLSERGLDSDGKLAVDRKRHGPEQFVGGVAWRDEQV